MSVLTSRSRNLWALEALNFTVHPLYIIAAVKAVQYPLQLSYRYSLRASSHRWYRRHRPHRKHNQRPFRPKPSASSAIVSASSSMGSSRSSVSPGIGQATGQHVHPPEGEEEIGENWKKWVHLADVLRYLATKMIWSAT